MIEKLVFLQSVLPQSISEISESMAASLKLYLQMSSEQKYKSRKCRQILCFWRKGVANRILPILSFEQYTYKFMGRFIIA